MRSRSDEIITDLLASGDIFRCPTCRRLFASEKWLREHQCRPITPGQKQDLRNRQACAKPVEKLSALGAFERPKPDGSPG